MVEPAVARSLKAELSRKLWVRIPAANFVGAVLAFAAGALTAANIKGQSGVGRIDFIAFAAYFLCVSPIVRWYLRIKTRRATDWLLTGREPRRSDQRAALLLPWQLSMCSLVGWVLASLIWGGITLAQHDSWRYCACVSLSILLGGLTTSGVVYLLVEWTVRPVVAHALAGDAPERAIGPGVRTKLWLSWLIGADVFLLLIGLAVLGRPANQPPSRIDLWFIIIAGFGAGSLVVYVASRSLATPLVELRRSVDRVTHGDLAVSVEVNDGGELGMVQAGFNQMVAGLRERRTLQDLFGRHVGEDVARLALSRGEVELGGERREVGVVFIDVIGSTQLAQGRPPEDVVSIVNRLFATIVRVVGDEGGWINKFEGDGALCVFGAPVSSDDCAQRALRAARTLRRELLALSLTEPALDAAIGVSAGTVVAGNVGAEQRYEYTVMGSPVNEASRLTAEAKLRFGRVLASEEAISRARQEAGRWIVADELQLRGFDEPILAYEPTEDALSEAGAGAPSGLSGCLAWCGADDGRAARVRAARSHVDLVSGDGCARCARRRPASTRR